VQTAGEFFITGSLDGHLKFWKKLPQGVEFVKHYRAHVGSVDGARAHFPPGRDRMGWGGELRCMLS
jgi:hypothetical protein